MTPCPKCGGSMVKGRIETEGLGGSDSELRRSRTKFVTGEDTSSLHEAFRQGIAGEWAEYRLVGARCSKCGFLELYAEK
jgi:hypothetical protein